MDGRPSFWAPLVPQPQGAARTRPGVLGQASHSVPAEPQPQRRGGRTCLCGADLKPVGRVGCSLKLSGSEAALALAGPARIPLGAQARKAPRELGHQAALWPEDAWG